MTVLPLMLLGLLGAEQRIDDFQYGDAAAAAAAWKSGWATPPVRVVADNGRSVVQIAAPFAGEKPPLRVYVDREVRLDLAAAGEFALEVACEKPEAVAHLTLYFRSGDGWYGATGHLGKQGWQTVRFSKASFRAEERPAGWQRIDGIRIAAWRGRAEDTSLRLRRLAAVSSEVALVVPNATDHPRNGEVDAALNVAERVAEMLAELGLGADAVDERSLLGGALGNRRVAVLAHNPRLSDEAAAALQQFVEGGGKLLVCYSLPGRLAAVLGFKRGEYIRQQRSGDFAEVRFQAPDVPGLPKSMKQASWNVTTAEPAGHNARVIGRWYDDDGKPTGHAAMLLSDRGAFFSHVILSDDREAKKQMLAAVLGHFEQSLWQQMAETALRRAERIGHCSNLEELEAQVAAGKDPTSLQRMDLARAAFASARQRSARGAHAEAVALSRRARDLAAEAYLRAQPSPTREGRAVWNHSGTGAYPGDWDRSAKVLAENGFNMVLPNLLWAGRAHYPSDLLPPSGTLRQYGDQVKQCCEAAAKHGLEVHVWKVNYNLSGAPREFVERLRREGRLQVTVGGDTRQWLCPSHPKNLELERDSMLEVARKYPIAGLHFDYIRYGGRDSCYCDGCRQRFEAHSGRKVSDWPKQCYSGELSVEYNDWRCRQITALVAAVHAEAKRLRPGLKISAAVFGSYPSCRESVAQDWPAWIEAGYLDFVCPMDYTTSDLTFAGLVENQLELVGGRIPVYPGIGATASRSGLSADRVAGQIHHARRLGAAGFTIFNFSRSTAESILPGVGLGAGARQAKPTH